MVTIKEAVATAPAPARSRARKGEQPTAPDTLAIDIGGTGLKAAVLSPTGEMRQDRVRMATPYPLSPDGLLTSLRDLVKPLGSYGRISVGFPGMVRQGKVLTAPHFVSPTGPGGAVSQSLLRAWTGYDLESALARALGVPTRLANDADLQGAAVIHGVGLEVVVTLGTGVGTAVYWQGRLAPHLELAQHQFRKNQTYNEQLGDAARKRIGVKKWNHRVELLIQTLHGLLFYDHLYIGGGNSARVKLTLDATVTLVDNSAGLLGGIRLWERDQL